MNFISKHF